MALWYDLSWHGYWGLWVTPWQNHEILQRSIGEAMQNTVVAELCKLVHE